VCPLILNKYIQHNEVKAFFADPFFWLSQAVSVKPLGLLENDLLWYNRVFAEKICLDVDQTMPKAC
jgi:hypothetical protein